MNSNELLTSFENLQEQLLICRPRDHLSFCTRFYEIEMEEAGVPFSKSSKHSAHCLPFLLNNMNDFRHHACTLFCSLINSGDNTAVQQSGRAYLDGDTVFQVVKAMDLGSFWCPVTAIDNLIIEKLEVLKRIDFDLFCSILRLPIAAYQLVFWLLDQLLECKRQYDTESTHMHTLERTMGDTCVDTSRLKTFLLKTNALRADANSTGKHFGKSLAKLQITGVSSVSTRDPSVSNSYYRMSTNWQDKDYALWVPVLVNTIDELSQTNATMAELSNEFLCNFFRHCQGNSLVGSGGISDGGSAER